MVKYITLILVSLLFVTSALAQDTLPGFTVRNIGNNRVIISWINDFNVVKQISIQRSHDSLRNYKTIATVPDPMARENGFADVKAPNDHMFYRLFISLDKGSFVFSIAQKPVWDTSRKHISDKIDKIQGNQNGLPNQGVNGVKPVDLFIPSMYVYTRKDGYVRINLPEAATKKYVLKFYDADGIYLFDLKDIRENYLTLDKSMFYHSGWFNFELFEDGKLIEKHKFYLPKEF